MTSPFNLYRHKQTSVKAVCQNLIKLNYSLVSKVGEPGDFSLKGDTLELFPVNFSSPVRVEWEFEKISKIYSFDKDFSKIAEYDLLIVIPFLRASHSYKDADCPIDASVSLIAGDYVVHTQYGIGKFLGIKKIKSKNNWEYFFEIEYAKKDKIYISKENAHLIQKYINFKVKKPELTRLGTSHWKKIKKKVEQGIHSYAVSMLKAEAQRKLIQKTKYPADGQWQKDFISQFPYQLTTDQKKAAEAVKQDMQSQRCMDRLLCGGVGYGKTEIAMRAAFRAACFGKQVAFLVPTTILAYQHFTNLCQRMEPFPLSVEMLSRFKSKAEQTRIAKRIREGKIDVVVGTHRLLSEDIQFKDLGLLIIDEEQKFGVEHKEKIKHYRIGIDVLTLTATPIPRTLYMSMVGIKSISLIRTPPKERLAVKTKIDNFDLKIIKETILRELSRKGQVFFIHNRIKNIEKISCQLKNILPGARIEVAHGRLMPSGIQKTMLNFIDGKIDVLISTAIVESGIDIPNANTIIINNSDRFGLSDLHQLRGRVGRFKKQAYALCLISPKGISEEAKKRLKFIQEFSYLGAGFELARRDLELRGAGNLLGKKQHGFIWMVGFDFYCRLLKKEVDYLREAFKI